MLGSHFRNHALLLLALRRAPNSVFYAEELQQWILMVDTRFVRFFLSIAFCSCRSRRGFVPLVLKNQLDSQKCGYTACHGTRNALHADSASSKSFGLFPSLYF